MSYPLLFSPVKIGPKMLRNRIFFTSHGMAMPVNGVISERYHNYLVERAKGGVGAIVTQSAPVHPSSGGSPTTMYLWREEMLPGYHKLSEALHTHNTMGLVMLWHQGHIGASRYTRQPLVAPSPIAAPGADELPKEMEQAEIDELIEYYARCARLAHEGGMDGVQLQTSADYLLGSFLSPALNRRQDKYGGSLENRMRIVVEILQAIRREVSSDFIVGLRTTASHLAKEGWEAAEATEFIRRLCIANLIDFVDVLAGSYYNPGYLMPLYFQERGLTVHYATDIREVANVPVGATGRIVEPHFAESLLSEGKVDLIGLARPLIADPEWANKAQAGQSDNIRLCISCNQGCRTPVFAGRPGGCLVNPAAGFEGSLGIGTLENTATPKKVLIVGGGPGGLETARIAAMRGHRVTLWEKADQLGGQWRNVASLERFQEFGNLTTFLTRQVQNLPIEIRLGQEATVENILAGNFEAVVLATGAIPDRLGESRVGETIPGFDQPHVLMSRQIFNPNFPVGEGSALDSSALDKTVIFYDQTGSYESVAIAVALVEKKVKLQIITPFSSFANIVLGGTGETPYLYSYLYKQGVEISPMTILTEIGTDSVNIRHIYSGAESKISEAGTVVLSMGNIANDSLYHALKGKVSELHRVGDCHAPRSAQLAIVDGHQVGREL